MSDGFIPKLSTEGWQRRAQDKMREVMLNFRNNPFYHVAPFPIAKLGNDVVEFAKRNGITLADTDIIATSKFISHSQRTSKGDLRVSDAAYIGFPITSQKMEVYRDNRKSLIFTDRINKFIIHPNYLLKLRNNKVRAVNLITAGKVNVPEEFDDVKHYTRIR